MEISVGDKVKFINENLVGEIISIISEHKLIVSCSDGFNHEVGINEILKVDANNKSIYKIDEVVISNKILPKNVQIETGGILSRYMENGKYKLEGTIEIDLHLEELVEFPGKLDDSLKLYTQLQHVKKCLNAAYEKKIKKIIFIHGVGTGVLKTELINYLATIDKLIVNDADFRRYGMGATEVLIKK